MSDVSEKLQLPYIMPQQAQKHVTHNEAVRMLDALVHACANSRAGSTPPGEPQAGEGFIVAQNATDEWQGREGMLAVWQDGAWEFYTPKNGFLCFVQDEGILLVHDGLSWRELPSGFENLPAVGIGAAASTGNSLTVSGEGTLLTHDPSVNDHRLSINKSGSGATATMLFQSAWSGRAEIGLSGNDQLAFKTSIDGTNWSQSAVINPADNSLSVQGNLTSGGDIRGERLAAKSQNFNYLITTIDNDHPQPVASSVQFSFNGTRQFSFGANKQIGNFSVTAFDSSGAWKGNALYIEQADTNSMNNAIYVNKDKNVGIGAVPGCELDVAGKLRLRPQTLASLPPASAALSGVLAFVSDATGGPKLALCDGVNWLTFDMVGTLS